MNTEATADTPSVAPAFKPAPTFVNASSRSRTIPLAYPVEWDGQVYSEIIVRRVTGKELAQYMTAIFDNEAPFYPGIGVPREVFEALDADDLQQVNDELADFLPLSFREAKSLDPEASAASPASSPTP